MLVPMTDEQRQEIKDKRIADQEYAKEHLKTEYMDQKYWAEKASEYGLRLPGWWIPSSDVKYIRRACKKLNVDINDFTESTGFSNLNQLAANNSSWNAVAMVGLVIEYKVGLES